MISCFGDPLDQKDQSVHAGLQRTDAIEQSVGAIFKLGHPGFERAHSVGQTAFEHDQPSIYAGDARRAAMLRAPNWVEIAAGNHER